MNKSTTQQIRERFDGDVERFSNLETGQSATIDAPLSLALIAGAACEQVFNYIAQEDSPRSLMFQLDLLRSVGFNQVEVLHKNSCFAAFGGIKESK